MNNSKRELISLLLRLWRHFSRRRQYQFAFLMGLMLLSAFAEVASIGAVLPFLGVLVAPEKVFANPLLKNFIDSFGITSSDQLLLALTILFSAVALAAGAIRLSLLWVSTRIAYSTGADLSIDLYKRTLYQPYQIHIARNSSEVISGITNKVNEVSYGILLAVLTMISSTILLIAIMSAVFAINTQIAVIAGVGFGASYGMITFFFRRRLRSNSRVIAEKQTQVVKALQEGLGGVRDVLLDGSQPIYCELYRQADQPLRAAIGSNQFISQCPRYFMESLGMLLIAVLAYSLSKQAGGVASAMPVLGALALGAQRLLPALQQIYGAWANIMGSYESLVDTVHLLEQPLPEGADQAAPAPLSFERDISFCDVRFQYGADMPLVIDRLNLKIAKGTRVGFVGATGSGKSTALDILMGLLVPTQGSLKVDGQLIDQNNVRAWQQTIAHVPQNIFLSDTTVAENIAFGVRKADIDMGRVRLAAQRAHIAEFIESKPDGYQSSLGERGTRLSGGQRQRIAIARAFYKGADVLIFDEATSALDNATEQSVMSTIAELHSDFTVLIIAHRLTTVRHCDQIVELQKGRVVACGTYAQLMENSASFKQMNDASH